MVGKFDGVCNWCMTSCREVVIAGGWRNLRYSRKIMKFDIIERELV